MIYDDRGWAAIKYHQPGQVLTRGQSGIDYVFVTRANICLAWVSPEDAQGLLNRRKNCCGGNKKIIFLEANESDVRRWTNGGGR